MRTSLHSCLEVRAAIELSFGIVNGLGSGIHVLDGGPRASRGRGCFGPFGIFGICVPICLNGQNDVMSANKCIQLVCEKLTAFPYGQDIIENVVLLAF